MADTFLIEENVKHIDFVIENLVLRARSEAVGLAAERFIIKKPVARIQNGFDIASRQRFQNSMSPRRYIILATDSCILTSQSMF